MTDLAISVLASQPDPYAAVPTLLLRLRIEATAGEPVPRSLSRPIAEPGRDNLCAS